MYIIQIRNCLCDGVAQNVMEVGKEDSKILLLCLSSIHDSKLTSHPSLEDLRCIFGHFGQLRKIIIFSRKTIFKAFVEFSESASALKAKRALNCRFILRFGRARIYPSLLESLGNSNEHLEYWEEESLLSPKVVRSPLISADELSDGEKRKFSFSSETCNSCQEMDSGASLPQGSITLAELFLRDEKAGVETSLVVLVSNLGQEFRSAREVFNLFSCFGHVAKVLMMKNLRKTLIEFSRIDSSIKAVEQINRAGFAYLLLKANFSHFKQIDLEKSSRSPKSLEFNEVFMPGPKHNKFGPLHCSLTERLSRFLLARCQNYSGLLNHLDIYLTICEQKKPIATQWIGDAVDDSPSIGIKLEFANIDDAIITIMKLQGTLIKSEALELTFVQP